MSRWSETRDTLQASLTGAVSAARAEWSAAPSIPRAIWVALPIISVLVLARLAWREPDDLLPPLPVLLLTALVAATAITARALAGAWCGTSPARLVWPALMTFAPLLLLQFAFLPHVSAFTAGGLLAILFGATALTAAWDLAASPLPGEQQIPPREEPSEIHDTVALGASHQWLRRSSPSPGQDLLEGRLRVRFDPGERITAVHVPLWPPFPSTPFIECEVTDDSEIRTTVTARYSYGFRVELRRSDAMSEETCELAFVAQTGQ
jgi:hypothetical protein